MLSFAEKGGVAPLCENSDELTLLGYTDLVAFSFPVLL